MWRCFTLLALTISIASPSWGSTKQAEQLSLVVAAIKADDWPSARRIIAQFSDPAAKSYAQWRRLRSGKGEWREYPEFLATHSDWPGLPLLRKVGEGKIPVNRPAREILAYFQDDLPQTGRGALRLAQAFDSNSQKESAQNTAKLAWLTLSLADSERNALLKSYKSVLTPHHWARTDHLIWTGRFSQAQAMKPLLSKSQTILMEARVALRKGQNGVNKLINALPSSVSDDPGLAYDRFRWRLRRDLWDGAGEILNARSASRASLGRPEVWSDRRRMIARRAMRASNYKAAYNFASRHHLKSDESGFIDLEWLSGYLKLVYLKDPKAAVEHFRRLRSVSVTPITQGRVWYWLGRAHEASGNIEKASEAYGVAAKFQTSFYGQMATQRADLEKDGSIADLTMANWKGSDFLESDVFKAGVILQKAGQHYDAGRFFAHMAETMNLEDQTKLGQYLVDLREANMALRVSKNAARLGRVTINSYYPVTELAELAKDVPPELVMAIARQESELNQNVESPVGARGMMQVMPRTAKEVAQKIGQPYSLERLSGDWKYNATIGIAYLDQMLKRYDGSFVLAAAAYNAGPHRADRWIKEHGDPRSRRTNTEQWIEKIQFRETRNYVQRVMESVEVYRARLSGDISSMKLVEDLKRGG